MTELLLSNVSIVVPLHRHSIMYYYLTQVDSCQLLGNQNIVADARKRFLFLFIFIKLNKLKCFMS